MSLLAKIYPALGLSCLLVLHVQPALAQTPYVSLAAQTQDGPSYLKRAAADPVEQQALLQLCQQFQRAIREKDGKLLASLLLHEQILFSSPANPDRIKHIRSHNNPHFNGVAGNGALDFIRAIAQSKSQLDEKFYNIQITQDQHLAWLNFDFEFLDDGLVINYGQEHWQLMKNAEGDWKILSVVWSSHGKPAAKQ